MRDYGSGSRSMRNNGYLPLVRWYYLQYLLIVTE